MAKSPNWTDKETAILKEHYPVQGGTKELYAMLPGRNQNAIKLKARKLGLAILNNPRKRRTQSEYLELLLNTNFTCLEEYLGSAVPILHKCKICSHTWNTRPQNVLRDGAQCPECDLKSRRNSDLKVLEVLKLAGLEQLTPYTGALNAITLKHIACGHLWTTVYRYIQQGSGCPMCNNGFGYLHGNAEHATIYLLEVPIQGIKYLKIGVTVQRLKMRISSIACDLKIPTSSISILHQVSGSGIEVFRKEQLILSAFERASVPPLFAGYTECLLYSNNIDSIKEIMDENI